MGKGMLGSLVQYVFAIYCPFRSDATNGQRGGLVTQLTSLESPSSSLE